MLRRACRGRGPGCSCSYQSGEAGTNLRGPGLGARASRGTSHGYWMTSFEALSQLSMAFVAFATIVITVRTSTGGKLTQFQLLLTHFFISVGLMAAGVSALALTLLESHGDTPFVWRVSTYVCLGTILGYMPFYLIRRRRIQAPTPPVSVFVTAGYGAAAVGLLLTIWEGFWEPSFAVVSGFVLWTLVSSGLIFVSMFEDFIGTAVGDE